MRKLVLTAVTVVTALAFASPSAFAETEAPASPNQNGTATSSTCTAVSKSGHTISGGCAVHATGTDILLVGHTIFGESTQMRCDIEFTGQVDWTGSGWIPLAGIAFTHPADGGFQCSHAEGGVDVCDEATATANGHPGDWQITRYEDASDGSLWMDVEVCVEGTSVGVVAGDLWTRVTTDGGGNVTGFTAQDHRLREETVTGDVEFDGSWAVEGNTVSIAH